MNILILFLFLKLYFVNCNYNINDDVLFGISWKDEDELLKKETKGITIVSRDKESFRCVLPSNVKDKFDRSFDSTYNGPSERELLKPLLINNLCSVKIESYWSYEICHGRHVRQFHEDSAQGKQTSIQEYSLGIYHDSDDEHQSHSNLENNNKELPTVTINSINFPYFRVNMTNGTKCDLIGHSRSISILYICQPDGRGEVYEINEIRTCHYQAIVFTKLLCAHPGYTVTNSHVNQISCHPIDGVNQLPKSLSVLQQEIDSEVNSVSTLDGLFNDNFDVGTEIKVEAYKENGVIVYRIKALPKQNEPKLSENLDKNSEKVEKVPKESSSEMTEPLDQPEKKFSGLESFKKQIQNSAASTSALLQRFMSGKFCVDGGEGWWRHRVCYNRKISQYHMEMHIETSELMLGLWKEEMHKQWLLRNPDKKPSMPAEERIEIYQYFSEGSFCDEVKAKRDAVLRIRCVKGNSSSISISFLEPRTCSYIVTIESSLFCPMIRDADEFGLVSATDE